MYVDSSDLNSPVAMETDIPLIEDVQRLKKTVEEGATQVNLTLSLISLSLAFTRVADFSLRFKPGAKECAVVAE